MKRIALIPIDNRPVCYTLPQMTADLNPDIKLYMPSRNLLGSLVKNANIDGLFDWLEELPQTDYIIISADTLIYGGLIPSRRSDAPKEEIEKRILKLRNILLKKSDCKVFLFSSIMRISNNNFNEEEKEYWSEYGTKLFAYSYNFHRFEAEGSIEAKNEVNKLINEIPQEILIDWLETRERNFEINKMYLDLYDNKLISTLIYSKDDCAKYGFNIKEANYFELKAEKKKNVFVKTGADEIPLTLLARCISDGNNIKIAPVYTNPGEINLISNYEDISVKNSVESQILTAGAKVTTPEDADMILYVNNFKSKQGELVMNISTEEFSEKFSLPEKPYFIADIRNANGADNKFINELLKTDFSPLFKGYAGWNTTGNTLGSAISAAISFFDAKAPDKEAFKKLQTVRLLDDWAYQANIRKIIKEKNITGEKEIKEFFKPFEEKIKKFLNTENPEIFYVFPWNRFFEIEIKV